MRKHCLSSLVLCFFTLSTFCIVISCSKEKSTDAPDVPNEGDPSLVGTWDLLAVEEDDHTVDPDSLFDLPVKMTLESNGTGQVWIEDYGHIEAGSPYDLTWHTSGNQFVIQLEGEDEGSCAYTLDINVLYLQFPNSRLTYVRA